ncbi:MAG: hypothetical protein KIT34_05160 [Cyanobacteria bacterium TGS_CYA1]|nr:hypothetical protein [Cyanobacteria bacterium TGS_CYA1]
MIATSFAPIAQAPLFMPLKSQEVSLDELVGVSANVVQELGFMIRSARSSEFLKLESMRRKLDSCINSDAKCVCKKCIGQD